MLYFYFSEREVIRLFVSQIQIRRFEQMKCRILYSLLLLSSVNISNHATTLVFFTPALFEKVKIQT